MAPPLKFRAIYDDHAAFVRRLCARRGVPPPFLDDVVQEVFVVVHDRFPSYEGRSSLRTWIAGIVRNVTRAQRRRRAVWMLGHPLRAAEPLTAGDGPSEVLARKDGSRILAQLLARMTKLQREAFILCDLEGMSAPAAAAALAVNEHTLRTRLRAARQSFDRQVAELWQDSR